ncbi:hypothetical protein [Marinimicrobium agarilyticum]|uniref:hypothetical protein n=1 Tax=Marinimicrobium agarilyticum TaxID=306546 RepID=UPI00040387F5|nr:hypothetical protein [Marinimicrobium agarilyticum]
MTQIGEGVAIGAGKDPKGFELDDNHWLELDYLYQNGTPLYGTYRATDNEGMEWNGRVNDQGQVCLAGLPDGKVQVDLLPETSDEKALKATRRAIQKVLDQIIADQKAEAEEYERDLENLGGPRRVYQHIHKVGDSVWNAALGVVELAETATHKLIEISNFLHPVNLLGDQLKAAYKSYQDGELTREQWYDSINQNLKEEHQKDLARIFGIEPDDLSKERLQELMALIAEAYDVAAFIADDAETQTMLKQFAKDLAATQHSMEWAGFAGAAVFELVLAALLAVFTTGIGTAAQAGIKLRHAAEMRKLTPLFRKLAEQLRSKKLNKQVDVPVDTPTTTKTDQPEIIDLKPAQPGFYSPHPDVDHPKTGDRIHRREHTDGHARDPYTLQDDGKPMGAEMGQMPKNLYGMEELPVDHDAHVEQGWPTLNYNNHETFNTFTVAKPVELSKGTKIYRIVDETASDAGGFWAYDLPASKTEWRKEFAVKDSWNDNGYYVEHVVGEEGLKVWEGPAAGQRYKKGPEGNSFYLSGGGTQLFVTPNSIETSSPKLTEWPEL